MSETKPSETEPKKVVSRNVAIALGMICIILLASLAGALIVLHNANQQNTSLQNQNNNLQSILSLNESFVILDGTINATVNIYQPGGAIPPYIANTGFGFNAPCSGYAVITLYNSTGKSTGVDFSYPNSLPVEFFYEEDWALLSPLASNNTAVFPVFVSIANSSVFVRVSIINTTTIFNSATISMTYYY
jgi:hypothetical protein